MEMTINVRIGVTPELESLARTIFTGKAQPAPLKEPKAPAKKAPAAAEPVQEQEQQPAEAEAVQEQPLTEQPAEEKPAEAKPLPSKSTYTEEDIRRAMHECRQRIEGPDYKENTESEGYRKYHRALTSRFKLMAQSMGYDRPSALPAELRENFIRECAEIITDDKGELTQKLPF